MFEEKLFTRLHVLYSSVADGEAIKTLGNTFSWGLVGPKYKATWEFAEMLKVNEQIISEREERERKKYNLLCHH